jgi:acetyl-CoA synthetase
VALEHDLPVCGPNCNGIVAVAAGAAIWGDRLRGLEPGPVGMVTQSGNFGVNALGSRRGIRWHTAVSTGNQAVCSASDWLAALAARDGLRSIALFLESDDHGPALAEALAVCAERGIGVAVLKVGASEAGAVAAAAHTGSLAGDQRVFRALVEEAGGAWAEDFHDLLELARALAEPAARPRGSGGLAVLTCSGGDSGVAGDRAAELGIELPPLSQASSRRLADLLPEAATIANPLDYTAMIWGDAPLLAEIVGVVGADPAIDQLLLLYDQPADADESWTAVREGLIAGARAAAAAALVASTLPDLLDEAAALEFAAAGFPAVAGLGSALRCAKALRAAPADAGRLREIAAAARRCLDGVDAGDGWFSEGEAKRLIAAAGIAIPAGGEAEGLAGCVSIAGEVGWPVALKLSGPGVRHKARVGALELGLADERELTSAFARLAELPDAPGASYLVERMAPPGIEVLVAARADAVVPALVVGIGGGLAEALDDIAIVPLPAGPARITAALASLRGAALITDAAPAIVDVAGRIGELLLAGGLRLVELNPISVTADGAVALDAVARR